MFLGSRRAAFLPSGWLVLALGCTSLTGSDAFEPSAPVDAVDQHDDAAGDAVVGLDAADGADAHDAPDGALLSSAPKLVRCRTSLCDASVGRVCCAPSGAATCGACDVGDMLDCDEAADCAMGEVCCFGAKTDRTSCVRTSCGATTQACMTDAECATGKCIPFLLGLTTLGRCS